MIQNIFSMRSIRPAEKPTEGELGHLKRLDKRMSGEMSRTDQYKGRTLVEPGSYYLLKNHRKKERCMNHECHTLTGRSFGFVSQYQYYGAYSSCSFKCDQKIMELAKGLDSRIAEKAHSFRSRNKPARQPAEENLKRTSPAVATRKEVLLLLLRQKNCNWCGVRMDWDIPVEEVTKAQHLYPKAPTIDHIAPKSKGGSLGIENLCVCCYQCNQDRKPLSLYIHQLTPLSTPISSL